MHLQQRAHNGGKNGKVHVLKMVYQTMQFLPLNKFIFHYIYLGLDWFGIPLVFIILLFQLFCNFFVKHKA